MLPLGLSPPDAYRLSGAAFEGEGDGERSVFDHTVLHRLSAKVTSSTTLRSCSNGRLLTGREAVFALPMKEELSFDRFRCFLLRHVIPLHQLYGRARPKMNR